MSRVCVLHQSLEVEYWCTRWSFETADDACCCNVLEICLSKLDDIFDGCRRLVGGVGKEDEEEEAASKKSRPLYRHRRT